MSFADVDAYLATLAPYQRPGCETLRQTIRAIRPDAVECISYNAPAYRIDGKVVAGFAAFKAHIAYLPHSGSVLPQLADALQGYVYTPGSLHVPYDAPLPAGLLTQLLAVRVAELPTKGKSRAAKAGA